MRSFFLFVLLIAGAAAFTRNPPEVFYESSDHALSTRLGKTSRMARSMLDGEVVWEGQVTGPARETREQARSAAIDKAADQIEEVLGFRSSIAKEDIIELVTGEKESDVDLGPTMAPAKATTLTLEVTNEKAKQLVRHERSARASERIRIMWRVIPITVAALFVVAGYFRIADWTMTRWRKRA
jgi:hypothetical protein